VNQGRILSPGAETKAKFSSVQQFDFKRLSTHFELISSENCQQKRLRINNYSIFLSKIRQISVIFVTAHVYGYPRIVFLRCNRLRQVISFKIEKNRKKTQKRSDKSLKGINESFSWHS